MVAMYRSNILKEYSAGDLSCQAMWVFSSAYRSGRHETSRGLHDCPAGEMVDGYSGISLW